MIRHACFQLPRHLAVCGLAALLVAATAAPAAVIVSPPGDGVSGNGQSSSPFANVGDSNGNRYQQI